MQSTKEVMMSCWCVVSQCVCYVKYSGSSLGMATFYFMPCTRKVIVLNRAKSCYFVPCKNYILLLFFPVRIINDNKLSYMIIHYRSKSCYFVVAYRSSL